MPLSKEVFSACVLVLSAFLRLGLLLSYLIFIIICHGLIYVIICSLPLDFNLHEDGDLIYLKPLIHSKYLSNDCQDLQVNI